MIRAFALLNRNLDIPPPKFRDWLLTEHPVVGFKVPGLMSYEVSFVVSDAGSNVVQSDMHGALIGGSGLPFDAVVQLGFDFESPEEAWHAWTSSMEAKKGRKDTEGFTAGVTRLIIGESVRLLGWKHERS